VKQAVITGAAGGIGTALCEVFRGAGYRTIGVDKTPSAPSADAFVRMDLARVCCDEAYRKARGRALMRSIGKADLSVLINNAAYQVIGELRTIGVEDLHRSFQVNVIAPYLLTQMLLGRLEHSGGAVVNIASIHARLTKPGFTCYAASKAALVGLTRSLAVELGARVRVNAISPAAIETTMLRDGFKASPQDFDRLKRMHPTGRIGNPEEVARTALFLASDRTPFLTGAVLGLDGGIGARLHDPL